MDDRHGTRAIRVEVEVPGTPEQVWEAIATGPGISTWFVPAEVAEREGGEIVLHDLAPGLDDSGRITVWDPPRRLVYESSGEEETDASRGSHDHGFPNERTERFRARSMTGRRFPPSTADGRPGRDTVPGRSGSHPVSGAGRRARTGEAMDRCHRTGIAAERRS